MRLKHFFISLAFILILYFAVSSIIVQKQGYFHPSYSQIDLMPILSQPVLSENDYETLFKQTGIAKPVIDELKGTPDFTEKMLGFQKSYFSEPVIIYESLNILTRQEFTGSSQKEISPGFELAPYHNGYIFLTKSTYTMNWRHGHAGIVIDAKRGKTLEALSPGTISMEQDANKWRYYTTFKMMRPKGAAQSQLDEIALYASTILRDLPYNIFADKNQGANPYETHCSLLVWQAFAPFGFDLDATGGILVSPQNIAASPLLETLQIYGFNPDKEW